MLDVFFTVDVEIWCDGWDNLETKFPDSFRRYIYGPTQKGNFGLPFQLELLSDYGLTGVFFVEPLFSLRFGNSPLAEITGLIDEAGQEIQLHLHTEWVNEATKPLLNDTGHKRQFLRNFSLSEQIVLIDAGKKLLEATSIKSINAFRAGSFGFNSDTLHALAENNIIIDSSYNATSMGLDSGLMSGTPLYEPIAHSSIYEYPLTVFDDGVGGLRHAQLGACSYYELEGLLWSALESDRKAFVILSHNFELLNRSKSRPDNIVVKRMEKLCRFLSQNKDCFNVRGFNNLQPNVSQIQPEPLKSTAWKTYLRTLEQAYRRIYS